MSGFVDDALDLAVKPIKEIVVDPIKEVGQAVGLLPKAPKAPEMPEAPQTPTRSDDRVQAAADTERRRAAMAGGRASTILTGGRGLMEPAPVARRTLLG